MKFVPYKPLEVDVLAASSRMILPPVISDTSGLDAWAAGTAYVNSNLVKNSDGLAYMCLVGGTATTEPSATDGQESDGATLVWQYVRPLRNQVIIVNTGANHLSIAFVDPAVSGAGIKLYKAGGSWNAIRDMNYCPQGPVFSIAQGSDTTAGIQEA